MPAKKRADYYRARHAFGVVYEGAQITVPAGEIVPAGSPLLKQFSAAAVEEHFEPVTSFGQWDVEAATAAPGEKRGEEKPTKVESATAAPGEKRA
jgi:hypothetical protein